MGRRRWHDSLVRSALAPSFVIDYSSNIAAAAAADDQLQLPHISIHEVALCDKARSVALGVAARLDGTINEAYAQ